MHFLPWWALLACLAASAFAAYLLIGRTQAGGYRLALFALTAVAAPASTAGAATAVVLSTLLSAYLEDRAADSAGPPDPPARAERTGGEATSGRSTAPATGGSSSSPGASPGASPAASPSASASP